MAHPAALFRGFVLSDHADWPSLLATIDDVGARRVLTTHGHSDTLVRLLRERGVDAREIDIGARPDDEDADDATLH